MGERVVGAHYLGMSRRGAQYFEEFLQYLKKQRKNIMRELTT